MLDLGIRLAISHALLSQYFTTHPVLFAKLPVKSAAHCGPTHLWSPGNRGFSGNI